MTFNGCYVSPYEAEDVRQLSEDCYVKSSVPSGRSCFDLRWSETLEHLWDISFHYPFTYNNTYFWSLHDRLLNKMWPPNLIYGKTLVEGVCANMFHVYVCYYHFNIVNNALEKASSLIVHDSTTRMYFYNDDAWVVICHAAW